MTCHTPERHRRYVRCTSRFHVELTNDVLTLLPPRDIIRGTNDVPSRSRWRVLDDNLRRNVIPREDLGILTTYLVLPVGVNKLESLKIWNENRWKRRRKLTKVSWSKAKAKVHVSWCPAPHVDFQLVHTPMGSCTACKPLCVPLVNISLWPSLPFLLPPKTRKICRIRAKFSEVLHK